MRRQAAVQRARRQAIHIGDEPTHYGAQSKIEVSVSDLQRIKGPFDQIDATIKRLLTLELLELRAAPGFGKAAKTAVMRR